MRAYILELTPPNFSRAHGPKAGSSSLMKMPRYFTFGGPCTYVPAFTNNASCFCGGTSAHQYQGETPICSDSS
jgi:hypothetical protein